MKHQKWLSYKLAQKQVAAAIVEMAVAVDVVQAQDQVPVNQ